MNTIKIALLNSALLLGLSLNASAANATWTGGGDGVTWNETSPASNWNAAFPGTSGTADAATFSSAATGLALGQNISIGSITLNTSGNVSVTDTTHTLTLSTRGPISVGAGQTLSLDNASFTANGTATITLGSGSALNFTTSGTLTTGTTSLIFTGGTTTIGANQVLSYGNVGGTVTGSSLEASSGTLNVNTTHYTGTLVSGNAGFVALAGGVINFGASESKRTQAFAGGSIYGTANGVSIGSVVQIFTGTTTTNTVTLGANISGTGSVTLGGLTIDNGNLAGSETVALYANTNNTLYEGGISGFAPTGTLLLVKTGTGTVVLSGFNSFVATTSVSQGVLSLTNNTSGVNLALENSVLATGSGTVSLSGGATSLMLGGLSGSQALATQISSGYTGASGMSNVTLNTQTGASTTYSGVIANGATAGTSLTVTGTGTQTLSGASTFNGGTTVTGTATVILGNGSGTGTTTAANNTNGSATGSGTLTVGAGTTLGGMGTSAGSKFVLSGVTGTKTLVLVGQTSTSDTNTTGALTLLGGTASGNSTISNANLSFNLDVTSVNSGNKLNVGATGIDFSSGGVTLTLNMQNTGIIPANSAYVLIAGTGTTGMTGSSTPTATTGQFTGLQTFVNAQGLNQTLNSGDGGSGNLVLALTGISETYYGPASYLFINNSGGVDDIEVEVVPEPGTWALMLGGLAMLAWIQRKRAARSI